MEIRLIQATDNPHIAKIIRTALTEFGANKPGTVYYDESTDHLYELFQTPNSFYLIAEVEGKVVGGCGIYPTEGLPAGTVELVKMYIDSNYRGIGLGRLLIQKSIDKAKEMGFTQIYLESLPELNKAVSVYEKFGFEYLDGPLGNSGHFGCDIWMLKKI